MLYSAGIFKASSPRGSMSSNPERTALSRRRGEPGYIGVLQRRAGSLNIKILLLIKENQICQVKEFSTLYGKMQESGLTEIIPLICTSDI